MNDRVYRNPRPLLLVELIGGRMLGRCYSATTYRITSTRPLTIDQLESIRETRTIGYGQEHSFMRVGSDGTRSHIGPFEPSGFDVVPCSEVDSSGAVIRCPSLNPYSGEEDKPHEFPFYVYECEDRVDSGD